MIPSPAFIVLSAAKSFRHPTRRPNEFWQTDFTYLQVVGWGWYSRISDLPVVPWRPDRLSAPDLLGFRGDLRHDRGDTRWMNYNTSPSRRGPENQQFNYADDSS